MAITVALHRFESDPSLEQRDGVNLAHGEINRLLDAPQRPGLDVAFHDFDRLLRDPHYAFDTLKRADCVLCNVGPHAHYYFHLRQILGLRFRIIRDIKTALWSSYLLQECLCRPYLRRGDALLVTSNYSRLLTRSLFPHLGDHSIELFEPVLASADLPPVHRRVMRSERVTLGYVGRLSEDKNFPEVVDLLLDLNRGEPGRYRLVACGAVHSPRCDPQAIRQRITEQTGRRDLFTYFPPVPHEAVPALMGTFDYLLFFSTSNLEVLGRVLVEASHAGTPVLAAEHAAAPELVAPSSLVKVRYHKDQPFFTHFDAPMGSVDLEAAAAIIRSGQLPNAPRQVGINQPDRLFDALLNRLRAVDTSAEYAALSDSQRAFIEGLRVEGLIGPTSQTGAKRLIEELRSWFLALNGKKNREPDLWMTELVRRSRFKDRTQKFLAKVQRTQGDFTDLGGIDIELCHIAAFYPTVKVETPAPTQLKSRRSKSTCLPA